VAGGYSPATRVIVSCADGTSALAKHATDAHTAAWLRAEHSVYAPIRARFLAAVLAWEDDGDRPLLVLEDLSAGRWRVPWSEANVERVLQTLRQVASTPPPAELGRLDARWPRRTGWRRVADLVLADGQASVTGSGGRGGDSRRALVIRLEEVALRHEAEFIAAAQRSGSLHDPWVTAPADPDAFRAYVGRLGTTNLGSDFDARGTPSAA
jgi:hypothetical protein